MGAKEHQHGRRRGVLDLEAQFAFFRSQHRHPVNAAAHALLTGPILFTNLLILHFLPLPLPSQLDDPALALALAYAAAYLAVDRRAGALAGLLFLAAWAASRALAERLGFVRSWKLVLATQLFCWTWQFLGHGLFEKKGPTVSDLPEVFLMEPFLIFLQNVDRKIEADLKERRELEQRKAT
ncbi:2-hydroxy-palmitic acid dioxygenase MPO1-like isoform X2 [Phragmites australis]|uniref:2-hydroxy-palmitic acid dioxygenase MPO1-like isoform X2 n=1 Tax=Phragmites australis TaxID=29695 RepID=UPI002D7662BD|nr:2-hydroxy-palmitic acid dioxygenase MPO1-like isoform X2 [Phragmites australis]